MVKAGIESLAVNEFTGVGDMMDSGRLKGETKEEHAWNLSYRGRAQRRLEPGRCGM